MKTTRPYTMTDRARAAEQTRTRILDATADLAGERLVADISLDLVAQRAEVSVQTVLRHFGSRAGPLRGRPSGTPRAGSSTSGGPPSATSSPRSARSSTTTSCRGSAVLLMLAQEGTEALMASVTASGKKLHREWVETTFAPHLADADDPEELTDLLAVATDVYTWKLLRRDRGLSRASTEQRINRLVRALLATH